MEHQPQIMQGAEPYSAKRSRRGALILHGFTGSPQSMRPLAQAFAEADFSVELPRPLQVMAQRLRTCHKRTGAAGQLQSKPCIAISHRVRTP